MKVYVVVYEGYDTSIEEIDAYKVLGVVKDRDEARKLIEADFDSETEKLEDYEHKEGYEDAYPVVDMYAYRGEPEMIETYYFVEEHELPV